MRFTLNWLKEHLETIATPAHIADALVKLGVEVEEVVDPTAHMHNVVIGHVLAREQHPDADRLGVCSVDVGEAQPRQIVCGAPNVRAGLTVAVALEGACLPGDFKIKKSKIRGVESNGMICSARELNLGDDHTGIMELETTAKPGTPFAHTQSFDVVFDVSITPNRADVLSVYGITRDLAAAGLGTLLPLPAVAAGTAPPTRPVHIKGSGTHYFSSIEVTGLTNGTSPQWMQDKLLAAGLRPRNTVVDITNYLMLTYGQPLHAYDAAKVQGGFTATSGNGGKAYKGIGEVSLTTLDDDILIMDETSILGLAGILGGADCAVSDATTHVCLEAAWFNPAAIAASGQAHGIHSDARYRFERGINPTLTAWVGRKAAQMVQELCGGTVSTQLEAGNATPSITPIVFNPQKVTTFGGLTRAQADVVADLKKLGFTVDNETAAQVQVTPPPYRTFMETEEDLVEEVLRLNGLDNVPAVLPAPGNYQNLDSSDLALERKARRALAALGLNETITYSFISAKAAGTFAEDAATVTLQNPIDAENMSTMRPSLLPGLLNAAQGNMARGLPEVTLAEVGRVFTQSSEHTHAAALWAGTTAKHWQQSRQADIYTAKSTLFALLAQLGFNPTMFQLIHEGTPAYFHPGRCGTLRLGKNRIGLFGEIHPATAKTYDLKNRPVAFELNLSALRPLKAKQGSYTQHSLQPVYKDMAFLLNTDIPAGDVVTTIEATDKNLIQAVNVFDVYSGKSVPEGQKSLALSITLQPTEQSLTDGEMHTLMEKIQQAVRSKHGGTLRSA